MSSETFPFLLLHMSHHHRSSKEEAPSEVELKRCPTSALSTEPLPWDSRERLARELSIAKCRVQVGPHLSIHSPFQALHADPSQLKASGGLSLKKEFSLFAHRSGFKTNEEND